MIVKLGLTNIRNLMKELGDAQDKLRIIHIAGTNGKGSTGAFIESILRKAGYKVGRYTSPAVFDPFEVWRINGVNISKEQHAAYLRIINAACEKLVSKGKEQPSPFEIETALAFLYFYEEKCDYVLLEVGMGGETDATNLITKPLCSVLTSISMDHMQYLGDTLTDIAKVKAGIIKDGCPVVIGDTQQPEVLQVVINATAEKGAQLFWANSTYIEEECVTLEEISFSHGLCESMESLHIKLAGTYQIENANLAITVCKKVLGLSDAVIARGLEATKWPGRFEIVSREPLFVMDGAHNEDAAKKLLQTIEKHFTNRRITYIIGVLADKEHKKILEIMLPAAEKVFTVTPDNARALRADALAEEVESLGTKAVCCDSLEQAIDLAFDGTEKEDVIVAFGSLSYLADLKSAWRENSRYTGNLHH